jgi:hypothetical protein
MFKVTEPKSELSLVTLNVNGKSELKEAGKVIGRLNHLASVLMTANAVKTKRIRASCIDEISLSCS